MNSIDRIVELIDSESDIDMDLKEMDSHEQTVNTVDKNEFVEDEDVPADFFDDFLNTDFMDGLDVVDIWDDESEKKDGKPTVKKKSSSRSRHKESHTKRRRTRSSSLSRRKQKDPYKKRGRSRERFSKEKKSRERPTGFKKASRESKSGPVVDESAYDHRRDPEKTRRDIQKDKDKCAKNQEEKVISEKLKVVETGLVPPGTELDVDINVFKSTIDKKKDSKLKAAAVEKRSSTLSHKSDKKYVSTHPYAPKRDYRYERSPYRPKSKSLLKHSRSPLSRRRRSLDRRIYADRKVRYRDYSPERYPKRSRSPSFEISPEPFSDKMREKRPLKASWAARSSSHSKDFLEELADKLAKSEKKKYYKKVQQIIGQPSKHSSHYQSVTTPAPVPAPIQMPVSCSTNYYSQHMEPTPQYDHHFFIGQTFPSSTMHYSQTSFVDASNVSNGNMIEAPIAAPMEVETPCSNTTSIDNSGNANINLSSNICIEVQKEKEKETIHKLFEDKKISLSDFLSMSAKHGDSTEPINVQKKIRVISLCQDAIKILGNELLLSGRFFLKKSQKEPEKPQEGKFMSPLRKIPIVRFSFTTPSKSGEEKTTMQTTLSKLLSSVGVAEIAPCVPAKPSPNVATKDPTYDSYVPRREQINNNAPKLAKMCQTDPVKCQVCEIRKSRTFVTTGTQCEFELASIGTQMSDDDLVRFGAKFAFKDNLKNQSLTHLTPAQLMRQTLSSDDHLATSRMPSDKTPEKQNYRPNEDFNRSTKNENFARQIFGFETRAGPDKFAFSNFSNPPRLPGTSQFENRPRFFESKSNTFEKKNSTLPGPNKGVNAGGNDTARHNFSNNPNLPPNRRSLLPTPYAVRKY